MRRACAPSGVEKKVFFSFFMGKKWASRAAHAHTHTHVRAMCSNVIRNGGTFICLLNVSLLASLLTSIFFSPPPPPPRVLPFLTLPRRPAEAGRGRLVYQTPFKHKDNSPHISGVKGAFNTKSGRGDANGSASQSGAATALSWRQNSCC